MVEGQVYDHEAVQVVLGAEQVQALEMVCARVSLAVLWVVLDVLEVLDLG